MGRVTDGTTPAIVTSALREHYEFIHELNESCQLNLTPREIIALANQVDYVPEGSEPTASTQDVNDQDNVTGYSLHSVVQVDSSPRGDTSKAVCPDNGTEKQPRSRSVIDKPERGCLIIKLTSREHLAVRHYNKAEGCFEKLNSCLSTRNVQIYLSNNKPHLTVKGNRDFDIFSGNLLKLIHLAGYWWDHRKDKIKSKSSFHLSKETKSGSSKQLFGPVDVPEDTSMLADKVQAVPTERDRQSNSEKKHSENFIFMPDPSPEELLAKQCPHLCKDFPDCFNTIPDRIVSSSCEVVYICNNSKHDLFIRADQQLDIIKRLNLKFEGVRISLLRKFPAFHVLPPEGVNPQFTINAISKLRDRCSSLPDIAEELRGMRNKLYVYNSEPPVLPSVREATESSSNIQEQSLEE